MARYLATVPVASAPQAYPTVATLPSWARRRLVDQGYPDDGTGTFVGVQALQDIGQAQHLRITVRRW